MVPRAYWKGFLRLSLVTCPIAIFPATSESSSKSGAIVENRATRIPMPKRVRTRLSGRLRRAYQEQRASGWFSSQLRQLRPCRICGIHAGLFRPINGLRADAADFSL